VPVVSAFCPNCRRTVYVGEQDDRVCPMCSTALMATRLEPGRADRIGQNESSFRALNEEIEKVARSSTAAGETNAFLCECSSADCSEVLYLTIEQYEAVRGHPARFIVVPGHEVPEVEQEIDRSDGFAVVEKLDESRDDAERGYERS
jgi:hypothetical protein